MKTEYYLQTVDVTTASADPLTPPVTGAAVVSMTALALDETETTGTTTLGDTRVVIVWVKVTP